MPRDFYNSGICPFDTGVFADLRRPFKVDTFLGY